MDEKWMIYVGIDDSRVCVCVFDYEEDSCGLRLISSRDQCVNPYSSQQ